MFSERNMIQVALLLLAVFVGEADAAMEVFAGTTTAVSDGDTLWVRPDAGGPPRKLRIDGIDAPEMCQTGGQTSRDALSRSALNRRAQVTVRRYDDYGRGLARIVADQRDLGAHMVQTGHAWSYRWRNNPGPYAAEERLARQSRLGIFVSIQLESPRDFRKRHGPCNSPKP